jgi:hypothetical protein
MASDSNSVEVRMEATSSPRYRRRWTEAERTLLRDLYGLIPMKEIARRLDRTEYGVVEQARSRHMGLVSVGRTKFMAEAKVVHAYNRRFFATLTAESAYWAGFLAADGCLHPKRRTVQVILNVRDRSHLEQFARSLGYTGRITDYHVRNKFVPRGAVHSRICLCHAQDMLDDLRRNFNLTERKSLTLVPPTLSLQFAREFIRGLYDGDGSVYRQRRRTLGISLRGTAAVLEWVKSVFDTAIPTAKPVPVRISSGYPYYSVLGKRAEKCYFGSTDQPLLR